MIAIKKTFLLKKLQTRSLGLYCWGNGKDGKLGNGTFAAIERPMLVSGLEKVHVLDAACGINHSVVLLDWPDCPREPLAPLQSQRGFVARFLDKLVQAPEEHLVDTNPSIRHSNYIYSFGSNFFGQCGVDSKSSIAGFSIYGDDDDIMRPVQTQFPPLARPVSVCASGYGSFAVANDSDIYAWGGGALGLGNTHFHSVAQQQKFFSFYERKKIDLALGTHIGLARIVPNTPSSTSVPEELYFWGPWDSLQGPFLQPALVTHLLGHRIQAFGAIRDSIGFVTASELPKNQSIIISVFKPTHEASIPLDYPYSIVSSSKQGQEVFLDTPKVTLQVSLRSVSKLYMYKDFICLLDSDSNFYVSDGGKLDLFKSSVKDFTLSGAGSLVLLGLDGRLEFYSSVENLKLDYTLASMNCSTVRSGFDHFMAF